MLSQRCDLDSVIVRATRSSVAHGGASGPAAARAAFTLVEMITVMAVIVIMFAIVTPAVSRFRGNNDFKSAAGNIASTIEQARSYAMANNTYVYVGIGEYLVTEPSSASSRTSGIGQLAVAIVASRDGTRGYDVSSPGLTWSSNYTAVGGGNGSKILTAIDKLSLYDNVHLVDFGTTVPASGNMAHPVVTDSTYRLGNTGSASVTPFTWPLGQTLGGGQYNFTKVIQFDPQGVARIQTATNTDSIAAWMEIDLQPTHGTVVASVPSNQNVGDQASIIIDCMTGAIRSYRP